MSKIWNKSQPWTFGLDLHSQDAWKKYKTISPQMVVKNHGDESHGIESIQQSPTKQIQAGKLIGILIRILIMVYQNPHITG